MRRLREQRLRGRRLWGQLLAQLTLLLPLLQYAWGQCASGNKDPHLNFAHGGTADFRGRDKTYFNFFSGPKLSVNVLIEDATFVISDDRGSLTVDGTYITQVHLNAIVGGEKQKPVRLSVRAPSARSNCAAAAAAADCTNSSTGSREVSEATATTAAAATAAAQQQLQQHQRRHQHRSRLTGVGERAERV